MFSTSEAGAKKIISTAVEKNSWDGEWKKPAVCVIRLSIAHDKMMSFVKWQQWKRTNTGLELYVPLERSHNDYEITVVPDSEEGSEAELDPISEPSPPSSVNDKQRTVLVLYGGFLKVFKSKLQLQNGLHWMVQPGGYGRISLARGKDQWKEYKYDSYQKQQHVYPAEETGAPELMFVEIKITAAGLEYMTEHEMLEAAHAKPGVYYMKMNLFKWGLLDNGQLAYTVEERDQ